MTMTPARRRALEVMAASHPRPACYSNSTAPAAGARVCALVYWQAADWMRDKGLARSQDDGDRLVLTAAGLKACREAGIPIRERAGVA